MKHTDEQIITTVRKILDALHDPDTGFNAFRKELREQHLKKEEYEQRIVDKEYELAEKYGLTKANNRDEVKFKLTATIPVAKKSAAIRRNRGFLLCAIV